MLLPSCLRCFNWCLLIRDLILYLGKTKTDVWGPFLYNHPDAVLQSYFYAKLTGYSAIGLFLTYVLNWWPSSSLNNVLKLSWNDSSWIFTNYFEFQLSQYLNPVTERNIATTPKRGAWVGVLSISISISHPLPQSQSIVKNRLWVVSVSRRNDWL